MRSTAACALLLAAPAAAFSPAAAPKSSLKRLFTAGADAVLADPVDKRPLERSVTVLGNVRRESWVSAGAAYPVNRVYADLLPTSGRSAPLTVDELRQEVADLWGSRVQTGLFRSPLTAFLYERGWRQGFKNAGFPGIEAEYEEVSSFFAPAAGGVVVDMSCGSGLMTRRLVGGGAYARVVALDYSEAMLTETARRFKEESVPTGTLTLARADVAELPLQRAAVDAVHAGAALHCWPRLELGLAEIRACLKPGGRFFATTFLSGAYGVPMPPQSGGGSFRFFESEDELKRLLVDAGFDEAGVEVRREGRGCAIIRAVLPQDGAEQDVPAEAEQEEEAEEDGTPGAEGI